jgi:hypothetical protein
MNTKAKHTAGPWHVEPKAEDHGASLVICDTVEGILAVIPPLNDADEPDHNTAKRGPHDAANAALMASAPELLSVLEVIAAQCGTYAKPGMVALDYATIGNMARQAIAKAKGAV